MAFEPNFEKITASYRKNLGNTQSQIECKLPINDEVAKVVCASAKAYVTTADLVGKEVQYSGFVSFAVLYQTKENEISALDYTAEFKDSYATGDAEMTPAVSVGVVDVNTQVVNGEIRVVAIVESVIDGIFNESQNALTGVNGDNVFAKNETIDYSTFVATVQNKFEESLDVEIKDGVSKILTVCPSTYIDEITINDRFLTLKGGVFVDVCYVTDNNILRTTQCKFDFEQEIAQDEINPTSFVQSNMQVAYNDIKITTSIDTDSAIVNVNLPILFTGYVFNNNSTEIVGDLFSTTHFINMAVNSTPSMQNFEAVVFDDKVNGSVTIQDTAPFIDEMLGVCCSNVALANATVQDGTFSVEGVAHTTALYLNKELGGVYSVEVEMPFSISSQVDLNDNVVPLVQISMTDVSARARRGKEIEVNANLNVFANFYDTDKDAIITAVTEEDEVPEEECALSIYLAKDGDTIWEIAKELKVSPEMLVEQNPGLAEPITAGQRIAIYRQKQVEY